MYSIMNNCWRHYLRRRCPDCELDEEQLAADSDPEHLSGQQEIVAHVRTAIARLPVGQREVLTLVDLEGFAYQEVADILEIPIGTVMSRLSRARGFLQTALRSLRANKVRSALTMLGIIIGVAAVIAMLSIGRGAQALITSQIEGMGTNLLFVRPGAVQQSGVRQAAGSAQTLTYEDAQAIADPANCPSVAMVAPEVTMTAQIVYQGNNANMRVAGVTPEYAQVRNYAVADGEFIAANHVTARSLVAVLGANTALTLFGDENPIGQSIRINNVTFRVIGVLAAKGGSGFGSQDDVALIPLTAHSRLGRRTFRGGTAVSLINVQVGDAKLIDAAVEEISALLRERHRTLYEDDFQVSSQADILSMANEITGILTIFLGGVAAISLLVGGIGIMNIMLVSVTERTREIGIRKAVGAKRRDILAQFLTEATLLSVVGGGVGIILGWGLAGLISQISANYGTPITTVLSADSVFLATSFSIGVGLFFGIYPAIRAASLHPIDALRYE
jgi:putative ABC transport system permease protein